MKKEEWNRGLNDIDSDLVEEYVQNSEKAGKRRQKRTLFIRLGALAACFCVLIGAVLVPVLSRRGGQPSDVTVPGQTETPLPELPVWGNAHYSAEQAAAVFPVTRSSTTSYEKVYAPEGRLGFFPVPEAEELGIYCYQDLGENDREGFEAFAARLLPGIAAALGIEVPEYEIVENMLSGKGFELITRDRDYLIDLSQRGDAQYVSFDRWRASQGELLVLDGTTVQIDQRLTDAEILSSLAGVREILDRTFGVSFPDAKISRSYGGVSKYGAEWITVYFYEESAHALNAVSSRPVSDFIGLSFQNIRHSPGDKISDSVLTNVSVMYKENRSAPEKECLRTDSVRRISVKEAEALLLRGYVFGGHSCPICMREQRPVSFDNYDFVGLEYVFQTDRTEYRSTVGMPFYVFYKKIGPAENGNTTYAKTYVPAIEISGYVEYFEKQQEKHNTPWVA